MRDKIEEIKKGLNRYPAKSLIYLVGLDRLELSAN